jgi:hypothetical protein
MRSTTCVSLVVLSPNWSASEKQLKSGPAHPAKPVGSKGLAPVAARRRFHCSHDSGNSIQHFEDSNQNNELKNTTSVRCLYLSDGGEQQY